MNGIHPLDELSIAFAGHADRSVDSVVERQITIVDRVLRPRLLSNPR
jgi:hypothetical protein